MNGLRAFAHNSGAAVDYYPLSSSGGWEEKWALLVRTKAIVIRPKLMIVSKLQRNLSDVRPSTPNTFPGIFGLTGGRSFHNILIKSH